MGERISTVPDTPRTPASWEFWFDEPAGPNDDGWVATYECTRGDKHADMTVIWNGPKEDSVRIVIEEYPDPEKNGQSTQAIDIEVPKIDAQQKVLEVGETWIKAIDNE